MDLQLNQSGMGRYGKEKARPTQKPPEKKTKPQHEQKNQTQRNKTPTKNTPKQTTNKLETDKIKNGRLPCSGGDTRRKGIGLTHVLSELGEKRRGGNTSPERGWSLKVHLNLCTLA